MDNSTPPSAANTQVRIIASPENAAAAVAALRTAGFTVVRVSSPLDAARSGDIRQYVRLWRSPKR